MVFVIFLTLLGLLKILISECKKKKQKQQLSGTDSQTPNPTHDAHNGKKRNIK